MSPPPRINQRRRRHPVSVLCLWGFLIGFGLAPSKGNPQTTAANASIDQFDLYAAFLTKFPLFIDWPPSTSRAKRDTVRIGVIGRNTFKDTTVATMARQTIGRQEIEVITLDSLPEKLDLDLLFIGPQAAPRIETILSSVKTMGILTISATPSFAQQGGMINITTRKGRPHFEINLAAIKEEGLAISSKILRGATIVKTKNP